MRRQADIADYHLKPIRRLQRGAQYLARARRGVAVVMRVISPCR